LEPAIDRLQQPGFRAGLDLRALFVDHRGMGAGPGVADDGADSGFAVGGNRIDVNAQPAQRLGDRAAVKRPGKSYKRDLAAKLPEYPRDIASFTSRLHDSLFAALHGAGFEIVDLKNAIDGKIRADDQEHSGTGTQKAGKNLLEIRNWKSEIGNPISNFEFPISNFQ
jgi:hypothetical protein